MHEVGKIGFGNVVQRARKRHGWSQEELARKSGVSRPTIARIEGGNDVTIMTITKISQALGLTLELTDQDS